MPYTLTQSELSQLKSKLTRALNSRDCQKIKKTAEEALAIFEQKGYPDSWSRWQRAKDDAEFAISRGEARLHERHS
jgi:hypothetical protein